MSTIVTFVVTPGSNFRVKANGDVAIKLVAAKEAQPAQKWSNQSRDTEQQK